MKKETIGIAAGLLLVSGLLFLLLVIAGADAAYWVDSCVNVTHMTSSIDFIDAEDSSTMFSITQTPIYCANGCNSVTGKCNMMPMMYYRGIGFALLVLVLYIAFVIIKTQPKESEGI